MTKYTQRETDIVHCIITSLLSQVLSNTGLFTYFSQFFRSQDSAFQSHYPHPQVFGEASPDPLPSPESISKESGSWLFTSLPQVPVPDWVPGSRDRATSFRPHFPLTSGSMPRNAADFPTAASYSSRWPPGQRGSPRSFRAGARSPRRTGKEAKHVPLYPSVSVVSGDALSFFSLGDWRTGEGLFEEPAGGPRLADSPSCPSLVLGGGPRGRCLRHRLCGPGELT